MNERMRSYYERAQRCDRVNDSRAEDFIAGSPAARFAATVKETLATMATLDVERASSTNRRQLGTASRRSTRARLVKLVQAVEETAKVVALDRANFAGMFVIPRNDNSDRALIATARSFAETAASLTGLLVSYGLPANFVAMLRSEADSLGDFMTVQDEGVGTRIHANAGLKEQLRVLNETLEGLNVIYGNMYRRTNPAVYAEWKSAYHVEAPPGSRSKSKSKSKSTPPDNGEAPPDNSETPPAND